MKVIFTDKRCPYKSVRITKRTIDRIIESGIGHLSLDDFDEVEIRPKGKKHGKRAKNQ